MSENIEAYIQLFDQIPFIWLLLMSLIITLIENIFPPAPSDVAIVAIAIIVGTIGYSIVPIIIAATIGSTIGFWIMFMLGKKFEHSITHNNKFKFISKESIDKAEKMFCKWGFKLITINRFMSGTRAVVSFFAGMSDLPQKKTISLAGVSSLLWYAILAIAGNYFGKDRKILMEYMQLYEGIAIVVVASVIVIAVAVWLIRKFVIKKGINNN